MFLGHHKNINRVKISLMLSMLYTFTYITCKSVFRIVWNGHPSHNSPIWVTSSFESLGQEHNIIMVEFFPLEVLPYKSL